MKQQPGETKRGNLFGQELEDLLNKLDRNINNRMSDNPDIGRTLLLDESGTKQYFG